MGRIALKTGMFVRLRIDKETKNTKVYVVLKGTKNGDCIINNDGFFSMTYESDPLGYYTKGKPYYDVVEVYEETSHGMGGFTISNKQLLWKEEVDTIQLTSDYKAVVNKELELVQVGCQTIPFAKVNELHTLINKK